MRLRLEMMLDDEEGSEVADSLQTNVFRGPSSSFQLELPRRVLFQAKVTALIVTAVLIVGQAVEISLLTIDGEPKWYLSICMVISPPR